MEVRPGYKLTEVGVIPENWEVRLLPNVCRFRGGKAHEQHISELGRFVCVNSKFISTDGKVRKYSSQNFCCAKRDDIMMVMSDLPNGKALAKAFLADQDNLYAVNQRVCALTPYRDSSKYLFYVLNRNSYFLRFDDGVNQTHLLNRVFQKCPLPLPPTKAEQEAIARTLSDADALIESLEQLLAKKRQLKQGAMQELLTGKNRLPDFESKASYKQTEVGMIPEDWEVKSIAKIAPLQRGFDLPTSQLKDGPYPVVYSNGVMASHHRAMARGPGVVTGRSGTLGKVHYVKTDYWPHNTSLWVTRFNGNDERFVYYLYCAIGFERFASGSGVPTLNRNDAHAFFAALPPTKAEQEAIAAVLSDMDEEIAALEAKITKAQSLKQGMMQELLTGRIRLA
jgi:type I restriction enzyme S subunit